MSISEENLAQRYSYLISPPLQLIFSTSLQEAASSQISQTSLKELFKEAITQEEIESSVQSLYPTKRVDEHRTDSLSCDTNSDKECHIYINTPICSSQVFTYTECYFAELAK